MIGAVVSQTSRSPQRSLGVETRAALATISKQTLDSLRRTTAPSPYEGYERINQPRALGDIDRVRLVSKGLTRHDVSTAVAAQLGSFELPRSSFKERWLTQKGSRG